MLGLEDPDQSEADTRCKLIDPLFRDVLGWSESDIRREAPVSEGFVDYVFGADYAYFHVEAKRTLPRFKLAVPSRARTLKLTGPHLLANKDVKPLLQQAVKYSVDLGTEVSVVTNGSQFILFRTRLQGKPWMQGVAIVWHDYDDIASHFADFHALLSRDSVVGGSLIEAFVSGQHAGTELFSPIAYVWNPDREFVRNRLWNKISRVFGPLLAVRPDDTTLQAEIVQHCYVSSPLTDEADRNIDHILRDRLPAYMDESNVENIPLGEHGDRRFRDRLLQDIHQFKPRTFVLTGGVGSGKTTFLRRFAEVVRPDFIQKFCVWLHVDYLPIGNIDETRISPQLREYTMKELKRLIGKDYPGFYPAGGDDLRELFSADIEELCQTRLFGVDTASDEWRTAVNGLVARKASDDLAFTQAVMRRATRAGRRLVFVLDNSDQLGERFQEELFLFAQKLSSDFDALTIVSLREEKYFAAYRRGIFDAYGDRRFHVGSPHLGQVIRKRLEYGLVKLYQMFIEQGYSDEERESIKVLIEIFIRSTLSDNRNIVRMLACVSNGDMRHALDLFRDFVSSGNTDVDKILGKGPGYTVPFHEFAKSAILGSRKFFRSNMSHFVNLFLCSSARAPSHLTACRVLRRLTEARSAPSPHGEGFVDTSRILREWRESFGHAEDLIVVGGDLLRRGLIESEPPRCPDFERTEALAVSASGQYYWQYLVRSFAYVDLVITDTPVRSAELARTLGNLAEKRHLSVRFERVRGFLDYLSSEEDREVGSLPEGNEVFSGRVVEGIRRQIEREILEIRRRARRQRAQRQDGHAQKGERLDKESDGGSSESEKS